MTRLFIAILCALGLASSPIATSGAFAAAATMPGCTMDGHLPAKADQQSKMDCCTVVCQMTAALLPQVLADGAPAKSDRADHKRVRARELASFTTSGLDPPPRLPS